MLLTTPQKNYLKEPDIDYLPERSLTDLRFHAPLCTWQGVDGLPAFIRPDSGADAGGDHPDLLPSDRLVPGKAKLAPRNCRYRLGELYLDGVPVPVSLHRPVIRSRPCARHTAESQLA